MAQGMADILGLVRSGRLHDATDAIRRRLGGTVPPAAGADRPMRNVTPEAPVLPGPEPIRPRTGKPRPKPGARARATARAPGELDYRLHRPPTPVADAPFVVMLHGCTQTPDDFAAGTRMNAAADRIGAHVLWPAQDRAANMNGCWNWFEPAHQGRSGEAAAIAALARRIAAEVAPEASGLHVAGLSAGGAMAAILGASYPEIFASVGIHSGLPVGAARDVASAFAAMRSGSEGAVPLPVPAIVFHGAADRTVAPANGAAAAAGATGSKPRRRTLRDGGREVTVTHTDTVDGAPWREHWEVAGLGHAWSGGDASGSHADPAGPDASAQMLRFFAAVDASRKAR